MRKWIITAFVVGALVALALTARLWLPRSLAFLGANSTVIQTLSSLVQLLLWGGAGLAVLIRLSQSKPKATQQTEPKPPEGNKGTTPPRPRTVVSALHQLPPPPSDFTGRLAELTELRDKIGRSGVTISGLQGLGGVGKTALALKLAEQLMPHYPDAQFYLDLRGHDEEKQQPLAPADAMAHVIRAYHPTAKLPDNETELSGLYQSVLHDQRALLLMDNAADDKQVKPLIPPPSCVLLVTSRNHFTLPGIFAKDLDTLPPEDARALLTRIAPRIGDHAEEIARLCGRLPLALRLAASALAERRDLSPADYVRRLSDEQQRLKLLDKVEASLSLSYDLLTPDLQRLWRALAVFPATFDARAAAAVWDVGQDAAHDALGELVKYSLLDWDDTTARYNLHDLARLFANNRMSDKERYASQLRHAEHYLTMLGEAHDLYLQGGEAIMRGLALFDAEWVNIQAGQSWAAQDTDTDSTKAQLCSRYPYVAAHLLDLRLHPRARVDWLEKALSAARDSNNNIAQARILSDLGVTHWRLGELHRAIEFNDQALAIHRQIGNRWGEMSSLGNLGLSYTYLGKPQRGIEFFEQVLAISREIGDLRSEGSTLNNLGLAYGATGETHRSIEFYEQALKLEQGIGNRRDEAEVLGNLGSAYATLGELHRAIEFYEQQLIIVRDISDHRGEGNALWNMSLALDKLGDHDQATVHAEAALIILEQIEDPNAAMVRKQLAQWRGETE